MSACRRDDIVTLPPAFFGPREQAIRGLKRKRESVALSLPSGRGPSWRPKADTLAECAVWSACWHADMRHCRHTRISFTGSRPRLRRGIRNAGMRISARLSGGWRAAKPGTDLTVSMPATLGRQSGSAHARKRRRRRTSSRLGVLAWPHAGMLPRRSVGTPSSRHASTPSCWLGAMMTCGHDDMAARRQLTRHSPRLRRYCPSGTYRKPRQRAYAHMLTCRFARVLSW
jgi:hypothetical protein